jgi:predicted ArsR family transcriptional regulator
VLDALQRSVHPMTVGDVAAAVGLHVNTARFHLDGLVDAGLASRESEHREQPGRPRTLYAADPDRAPAGRRSYRLLAEILTSYLAGRTRRPVESALAAGTEWGRFLARRPKPFRRVGAGEARTQLVSVLDEVGFDPEAVRRGRTDQVVLHQCPFREIARDQPDVVCSVHLGLMRGLLDELDAPLQVERLDPHLDGTVRCVTWLRPRAEAVDGRLSPARRTRRTSAPAARDD